jgi:hypothetical protein
LETPRRERWGRCRGHTLLQERLSVGDDLLLSGRQVVVEQEKELLLHEIDVRL